MPLMARRSRGTGGLFIRRDVRGIESWYGQWWIGSRRVKRKLGLKRSTGSRVGLTRAQAERELQRLIGEDLQAPARTDATVGEVGRALVRHLTALGRKRSTVGDYESCIRVHLEPFFGEKPLACIEPSDVESFIAAKTREGCAPKSILNYLGLLHSIFTHGERRGAATRNPVKLVDRPQRTGSDPDIRYLDESELEALVRGVPDDARGETERVLYLTAAMTGLRQGELLGLRWRDVDWPAARMRVRQSYVRGEFGAPKSRRSSRSVPLADRIAALLDGHFKASAYRDDNDLSLLSPADRQAARSVAPAEALQGHGTSCADQGSALPRPAAHVWNANGWRRRPSADPPRVDGAPRLQDHLDLRGLSAE